MARRPRTLGLLALPSSTAALEAERDRLERELGHVNASILRSRHRPPRRRRLEREAAANDRARRLLAIERRRVVVALDAMPDDAA